MQEIRQTGKKSELAFIIIIISLSIFLRVYNLNEVTGSDDAQYGELVSIAIKKPIDLFYNQYPDEPIWMQNWKYTRPATVIPLLISTSILGNTPLALLMPTLISLVLSILILYYLVKYVFDRRIAIYSTIIFALSPLHILFSRNAMLHAQLTMLWLLAAMLFGYGVKKNKPAYIYLAAIAALTNHFTTDLRGLIPLAGLIPFYFLTRNKKMDKHVIAAAILSVVFVAMYLIIPGLFWHDWDYTNWAKNALLQGAGGASEVTIASPIIEVIKANIGMPIFTPLVGIIFIPMIYGMYLMLRRYKRPESAATLVALASISVFILSRQLYFERLVIYTPIFAILAAAGIRHAELSKNRHTCIILGGATLLYILSIPFLMSKFLNDESAAIIRLLDSTGLSIITTAWFPPASAAIIAVFVWFIIKSKKSIIDTTKKVLLSGFIILLIVVPTALVAGKIGEFDRARGAYAISKYLMQNSNDEKFICTSKLYDRAVMYYTKKLCISWTTTETDILMKTIESGKLRYVLVDTVYNTEEEYRSEHPEFYDWIIANSKDVTDEVKGTLQKNRFKLLEINT